MTPRVGGSIQLGGVLVSSLGLGSNINAGDITIGAGASITVDPGQTIGVAASGQITVDGTLNAPGGVINLFNETGVGGDNALTGRSIWLGGDAVLNAAGEAFSAQDQYGRAFGKVIAGGSVDIGVRESGADVGTGILYATDAFIIARPGSLIDVSGASGTFDSNAELGIGAGRARSCRGRRPAAHRPQQRRLDHPQVLRRHLPGRDAQGDAGGPGAAGGTFSALIATPLYQASSQSGVPNALRAPRQITIAQDDDGSELLADLAPGVYDPTLAYGQARFSADTLSRSGFSNLNFTAPNGVVFDGNVNLAAAQSISLSAAGIADTDLTAQVNVNAPYVQISGSGEPDPQIAAFYPILGQRVTDQVSTGALTVSADLIDVSGTIEFGLSGSVVQSSGPARTYDFAGFGTTLLQRQRRHSPDRRRPHQPAGFRLHRRPALRQRPDPGWRHGDRWRFNSVSSLGRDHHHGAGRAGAAAAVRDRRKPDAGRLCNQPGWGAARPPGDANAVRTDTSTSCLAASPRSAPMV